MEFILDHALGGTPILSVLTYTPIVGAILLMLFVPPQDTRMIRAIAIIFTSLAFVFSLVVLYYFATGTPQMQLVEHVKWIPSLGVSYFLGVDGISILLILLTTLLSIIVVFCSFPEIEERQKEYYVCLLFLETGMLGVFVALDFFLFYIFWEVMLVPMYFLIGIWGHGRRLYSAIKFFLYTLFGSVFMLLGILALYFFNGNPDYGTGQLTFNVLELINKLRVQQSRCLPGCRPRISFSWRFSLALPSKCRCFRFTPGYRMRTRMRRPLAASSWPGYC